MEQIGLAPVEAVTVTTLVDNVVDVFMPPQGPAQRWDAFTGTERHLEASATLEGGYTSRGLLAEHGFSALVSFTRGGREHHVLFDAGLSPDGLAHNMARLEIDPKGVEAVVLSHGHFDHTTGIDGFIRSVGRANLPVLIHPEFWSRRRITLPGREPWELPTTSKLALEDAGFVVIEDRRPSFLFDNSLLVTGEVDRTNDFERGFPLQQALRDGQWQADPLVLDDQALVLNVAGKGLVVMTGCGHAGVVNTVSYVQRLTGLTPVYAIIGGFHLNGPIFEPLIPRICEAFSVLAPSVIVPAHCTGWRACRALANAFPDAYVPNSVGTRFVF